MAANDWFAQVFQQYLGRAPTEADYTANSVGTQSQDAITRGIQGSPEAAAYTNQQRQGSVGQAFQQFLGRSASPDELSTWAGSGQDVNAMRSQIQDSPEATATGMLRGIFGKNPEAGQAGQWGGLLASGQPRWMVMRQMMQDPAAKAQMLKGYEMPWYDPNAYKRQAMAQRAQQPGMSAIEALFQKYFGQMQQNPYGWNPNAMYGGGNGPGGSGHGDGTGGFGGPGTGGPDGSDPGEGASS